MAPLHSTQVAPGSWTQGADSSNRKSGDRTLLGRPRPRGRVLMPDQGVCHHFFLKFDREASSQGSPGDADTCLPFYLQLWF